MVPTTDRSTVCHGQGSAVGDISCVGKGKGSPSFLPLGVCVVRGRPFFCRQVCVSREAGLAATVRRTLVCPPRGADHQIDGAVYDPHVCGGTGVCAGFGALR